MRMAITGHTSGIGEALFKRYSPAAVGFSRSNGFDISDAACRAAIVDMSSQCDVFINNAHDGFHQVDLLYDMQEAWKNTDRLIINISSNSGDGIKRTPHRYAVCKSALDKAAEQLSRIDGSCRIATIRPGYVDTPRVKHVADQPKVSVDSIVRCVDMLIEWPADSMINNITILPR